MLRTILFAAAALAIGSAVPAQTYNWTVPLPIPDAFSPGVCGSPVFAVFTVPPGATVTDVDIAVTLTHPYAGDIGIRLHHTGVIVVLADTVPFDASPLSGTYTFDDEAPGSLDAAMLGAPGAVPVPGGRYTGDGMLSLFDGTPRDGVWYLEVCDFAPGFSGTLTGASLTIGTTGAGGLSYTISQFVLPPPLPPGLTRLTMTVLGGTPAVPSHFCLRAFTVDPGAFPSGWFFGIDIGLFDLFGQISSGWPLWTILDIGGGSMTYIDGIPVGLGFPIYTVAVELDPVTFVPIAWSPPTLYTLL